MDVQLFRAKMEDRQLIENFMQFYMYDFLDFMHLEVQPDGLFSAYPDLDGYWIDNKRFPYIIRLSESPVGFVLVRWTGAFFSIAEFFVHKKYRRGGIATKAAMEIFNLHKGPWEVFQIEKNHAAQRFWQKIIDIYTGGAFSNQLESGKWIQRFESR